MTTNRSRSSVDDFMIDFRDEESGGGGVRVKEGWTRVRVTSAKAVTSNDKGTPGLELMLTIMAGKDKGKKVRETLWKSKKAYSRYRLLLKACGKKSPQRVSIPTIANAVKGEELYVEFADETREGYATRSRVTFEGFMSEEEFEEHGDGADEDDEDDEDDDLIDEEESPKRRSRKSESEDDEDDEDEEPAPRRRTTRAKTSTSRRRSHKDVEDDEDDLDLEDL